MTGRILHLISQYPGRTGSGVALNAIVQAAGKGGWNQALICGISTADALPKVADLPDCRTHPLRFDTETLPFALPGMSDIMPYPSSRFSDLTGPQLELYCAAWRKHVAAIIDEFRPDVIHTHHFWILSSLVKEIAVEIPVVTHCHGTGFRQLELCPHLAERVIAGCRRNDRFLVLHQGHFERLTQEAGIQPDRIRVIGSGFNPDIFHAHGRPSSMPPTVTYAGKLSNAKGLPWLLEASDRLATHIPDLVMHVAGSGTGEQANAIHRQMKSMGHVRYHGHLDQTSLADLLRKTTLFALPSFYEGLPLVLVEAAACGCRLVATTLPGITDQLAPQLGDAIQLVSLPRMKNIDCPVPEDLPHFVERLERGLRQSLEAAPLEQINQRVQGMTWDAVVASCYDNQRTTRTTGANL